MKYDLLHSLSSGGGFGLVLFFVGLLVRFLFLITCCLQSQQEAR